MTKPRHLIWSAVIIIIINQIYYDQNYHYITRIVIIVPKWPFIVISITILYQLVTVITTYDDYWHIIIAIMIPLLLFYNHVLLIPFLLTKNSITITYYSITINNQIFSYDHH
jgi:hypothetical protein